ncbi:MAG: glycosyltransferase family 2 protein [Planctomycetales bacterium]|nr:glycosyltransferase family 2 protein [Planctomycetales bacterium]
MTRVSIGLPVYNGQNYIAEAIASVLSQDFTDWELLISDNASTDQTESICRSFANRDKRIRYSRISQNRGAAWNFNHVFELSTGEYFRWLSHDDVWMPTLLSESVSVLDNHSDVILCSTHTGAIDGNNYQILDADGVHDFVVQGITAKSERLRLAAIQSHNPAQRYLGVLLHSLRCYEVYGLVRRNIMELTQLHPHYCGGEKVLVAELALRGRFHEIPNSLFFARFHDSRFTANNSLAEQAEHMRPGSGGRLVLPHQYRATLGYLYLIAKLRLPMTQRAQCLVAWCRFVCQWSKWMSIAANTLLHRGVSTRLPPQLRRGKEISFQLPDMPCLKSQTV